MGSLAGIRKVSDEKCANSGKPNAPFEYRGVAPNMVLEEGQGQCQQMGCLSWTISRRGWGRESQPEATASAKTQGSCTWTGMEGQRLGVVGRPERQAEPRWSWVLRDVLRTWTWPSKQWYAKEKECCGQVFVLFCFTQKILSAAVLRMDQGSFSNPCLLGESCQTLPGPCRVVLLVCNPKIICSPDMWQSCSLEVSQINQPRE